MIRLRNNSRIHLQEKRLHQSLPEPSSLFRVRCISMNHSPLRLSNPKARVFRRRSSPQQSVGARSYFRLFCRSPGPAECVREIFPCPIPQHRASLPCPRILLSDSRVLHKVGENLRHTKSYKSRPHSLPSSQECCCKRWSLQKSSPSATGLRRIMFSLYSY